jgi:hypothetical protein
MGQGVETFAPVKTSNTVQKSSPASSDTAMKGMDTSKHTSTKAIDHSKE